MPAFGTSVSTFAEGDGAGEGSGEGEGGTEPAEPVEPGTQNVADMTEAEKVAEAEALGVTVDSLAAASMAQLQAISHDSADPVQARLSQLIFGNHTGDDVDGKPQFDGNGSTALAAAYAARYEYLQGELDKIGTTPVQDMTDNQKVAEAEALGYSLAAIAGMSKEELLTLTHDSAEPVKARMSQLIYGNYTGDDANGKPLYDGNGSATLKAAVEKRLSDLGISDTDPSTMAEQEKLAEAAALGLTPEWISSATYQQLMELSPDSDDKAAQRKAQLIFGNVVGRNENGEPVYDGTGSTTLRNAYNERIDQIMNQVGTNGYSEVNWHNSPYHDFGVVRIARASISGYIWEDTNHDGIWAAGEQQMFPNQPITLERYWWGVGEDGTMGWILDTGFKANAVTDGDGYWHFDDLEVAGRRNIDGKQTMVLYGYRAYVDDLPKNYGVTLMNQGSDANADSDLDEMTKILDPADPQGGMIVLAEPSTEHAYAEATDNGVYLVGPDGTAWVIRSGVDSEHNDTGLVPFALASIGGKVFIDPEKDGLKGDTWEPVPGHTVYLERMVLPVAVDSAANPTGSNVLGGFGFNGRDYVATSLKELGAAGVEPLSGWQAVSSMETDENGDYRFDGLPMVDDQNRPYIYRVRTTMPDGYEWVPMNVGGELVDGWHGDNSNDADDSDMYHTVGGSAADASSASMAVLGYFQAGRTEPNAYGQTYNFLTPYNWVPEVSRPVDFGMYKTPDPDDPTGPKPLPKPGRDPLDEITVWLPHLPITGDNSCNWLLVLAAGSLILLLVARRRRKKEEEEQAQTQE